MRRGGALLELAVVMPILLMLVVGTIDFGRVFYRGMAVAQAARAGAEFGAQNTGASANEAGIKNAAITSVASDLTLVDGDIAWSRSCECATDTGVFSATSPANDCSASCAVGSHLVIAVNVTVTKGFTTIISYPRIPHTVTITRTVKIRVT
jgi:Flp pilus assembly protein TadG